MDRRTMLPPPFSHRQAAERVSHRACIACSVYYAQVDSAFCDTCKEDSNRARRKLTHYIQRYERTFNVGFELLFPGDEEFFGTNAVSYKGSGLNTIPTEQDVVAQIDTIPVPTEEGEIFIDITEEDFIETGIEDDMSLTYRSNTTDTDEYIKGLIDELAKARNSIKDV